MKTPSMIAIFILSVIHSQAQSLVGPIPNPGNGHLYYLFGPTNWTAMETQAVGLGGHLATIRSQAENDWVWSTFTAFNGNNNFFIGLTDTGQEGNFFWISGETSAFRNWRANEPNNAGGEDYVLMRALDGQWNDVSGLLQYGVVEVIPEPSTFTLLVAAGMVASCSGRRTSKVSDDA